MVRIVKFKVRFVLLEDRRSKGVSSLGIANRCYSGLCQVGTCYEQTIGATIYAYCQCTPGYRGIQCNQCLN